MFSDDAQLYSPVTSGEDGVVVHLGANHPGVHDAAYRARRSQIAAAALDWVPGTPAPRIAYTETEHEVWRTVSRELAPRHDRFACAAFRRAKASLALPEDHIPQLDDISERLSRLTGFRLRPAAGLVPQDEFYGSLADGIFHSTQYLRHHAMPLYTPEPDLIHEVIGHANLLAGPEFAELSRLAGGAARRCQTGPGLQFLANVFWYTLEFGVVREAGEVRAYGAGILSSFGELEEFRTADIRPLDLREMGRAQYDISTYQPLLYCPASMTHLMDAVGGFFAVFDDDTPARLGATVATSR